MRLFQQYAPDNVNMVALLAHDVPQHRKLRLHIDDDLVAAACSHGLASVALSAVRGRDLSLSSRQRRQLLDSARSSAKRTLALDAELCRLVAVLGRGAYRPLVIKGAALRGVDRRLEGRSFADIDIMIPGSDLRTAGQLLESIGYTQRYKQFEPRPGFGYRFRHAVPFQRDGLHLDLHQAMAPVVFGLRLPWRELWRRSERMIIGGREFRIPCPTHAAILSALHVIASGGGRWLRPWREAMVLLTRDDLVPDIEREVSRLRLGVPVAIVARVLHDCLGVEVDERLRRAGPGRLGDRARIWAMSGRRRWIESQIEEALRLPLKDGLRFSLEYLFPDRNKARNPGSDVPPFDRPFRGMTALATPGRSNIQKRGLHR